MKLSSLLILVFSFIAIATFQSCVIEGCTDPASENYNVNATSDDGSCEYPVIFGCTDATSSNYNSEATNDDGSCEYLGDVTFWNNSIQYFDRIRIEIDSTYNEITGSIQEAPECGVSPGVSFELEEGTYPYTAYRINGASESWSGNVTISAGECTKVALWTTEAMNVTNTWLSSQGGTDNNYVTVINNCDNDYDILMSTGTGQQFSVPANSTRTSSQLWDGNWSINIRKIAGSSTQNGCVGLYYDFDDSKFYMETGSRLQITIG